MPGNMQINKNNKTILILNMTVLFLLTVFFIAVYTYILQNNNSSNTLEAAVERNSECADAIHRMVNNLLTRDDFTNIDSMEDMQTDRYQELQSYLNVLRTLNSTRYLYTAKRDADGRLVYLIDGLDLEAEDFAYPGTYIEEEMIPYLEAALSGETVYSQEIIDTTWGHIFTACYPVMANDGSGDIIGALCMEMDMESTYQSIEKINRSSVWIAIVATVVTVLLMICMYLSMHKQKEKEREQQKILEKTAAAAEAANKAKSTFLFNMSHDIRTPMNAILGYADLAREHMGEPQKLQEYMDNIRISGEKLLSIINNVLELSRIENNQAIIEESVIHSGDCMDSCLVMMKTAAEEKHQTLTVEKNIRYPYIYIDNAHVCEVIMNIVSNAIKYTGEGGSIRCILNQLPAEQKDFCITRISIQDNGIGISEEFQKHIFESFSRERSSTVSGIDGTGLGMGIVKKLVDLMQGTIEVQSKLGEGSTFTVEIPCRIATAEEAQAKKACFHLDKQSVAGRRILLAEDNDLNAEIAIELIQAEGLEVERVADGVACVDRIEKMPANYYDLILMDIQMPVMDGYKATQVIRKMDDPEKANIPIIAMTANAFAEDRQKALAVGMNDHVAKPIDMNRLMQVFVEHMKAKIVSSF